MDVTFLGTGSAMPTGYRFQTGLLLEAEQPLLVDCGSGVLHALARTSVGYEGIDTLLLTHHHLDHLSDLDVLMKARWLAGETTLTVVGPAGTRNLIDGLLNLHEYMQDRLDIEIREVSAGEQFSCSGFAIESHETTHSMDCLAYRFQPETSTTSFVFSGDTEARTDLCAFADGATALAHDCSFPDDVDVSNHPTPEALGRALADSEAEIDRIYLTHLYPHTENRHDEMLESIATHYDGDVQFARDGECITLDSV